jgi:hypothetical protein
MVYCFFVCWPFCWSLIILPYVGSECIQSHVYIWLLHVIVDVCVLNTALSWVLRKIKKIEVKFLLTNFFYIMQARNNARIMITGSLDMFSNRYAIMWWFFNFSVSLAIIWFISVDKISSFHDSDFSDQAYRKLGAQKSKWSSYWTPFHFTSTLGTWGFLNLLFHELQYRMVSSIILTVCCANAYFFCVPG